MIYADTSLLLPIYVPEVNSDKANSAVEGGEELSRLSEAAHKFGVKVLPGPSL